MVIVIFVIHKAVVFVIHKTCGLLYAVVPIHSHYYEGRLEK